MDSTTKQTEQTHLMLEIQPKPKLKQHEQRKVLHLPIASSTIFKHQKKKHSGPVQPKDLNEQKWSWRWMESNINGRGPPRILQLLYQKSKYPKPTVKPSTSQNLQTTSSSYQLNLTSHQQSSTPLSQQHISDHLCSNQTEQQDTKNNKTTVDSKEMKQKKTATKSSDGVPLSMTAFRWTLFFILLVLVIITAIVGIIIEE